MPSLAQIIKLHPPLLLIDASSDRIQAGLLAEGQRPRWASRNEEAGVGVFECVEELGLDLAAAGSFAFCEGPGSILGIRTSAMALRIWNALKPRPTFAYCSLLVAAEAAPAGSVVIADARRGLWHRATRGSSLDRVPAEVLSGALVTPDGFRHWSPLPPGTRAIPYDLSSVLGLESVAAADLFRATEAPDAFHHRAPEYAKWTPQIHRAP